MLTYLLIYFVGLWYSLFLQGYVITYRYQIWQNFVFIKIVSYDIFEMVDSIIVVVSFRRQRYIYITVMVQSYSLIYPSPNTPYPSAHHPDCSDKKFSSSTAMISLLDNIYPIIDLSNHRFIHISFYTNYKNVCVQFVFYTSVFYSQ